MRESEVREREGLGGEQREEGRSDREGEIGRVEGGEGTIG